MKLRLLFLALTLPFFVNTTQAQVDRKTADRLYDELAFAQAVETYKNCSIKRNLNWKWYSALRTLTGS
jgi:hypothetical protein